MQKVETTWRKNGDWKSRYSQLYFSRRITVPLEEEPRRISFMNNESTPYTSLLIRAHSNRRGSIGSDVPAPQYFTSILSHRSDQYGSWGTGSLQSDTLGGHDTMLLDMVRAQSKEHEEAQDQTLDLPRDDVSDDQSSEACVHGLSMRATTERSVSRSRFSRISTRRDMDIPSILAFTTTTTAPRIRAQTYLGYTKTGHLVGAKFLTVSYELLTKKATATYLIKVLSNRGSYGVGDIVLTQLEIPAFQKVNAPQQEPIPRWSIRRSVCPVCSQKWRDRTTVTKVKYSGLKRNSSSEMPSVIAPARLRAAITMAYVPRPALAVVDESGSGIGIVRRPSATWQLTRARRFRAPKPQVPSPEATAPPSAAAPMARKDLDIRVNKFLTDEK